MANVNNITLDDGLGQALELRRAKAAGIETLVELTTESIGRNPERLVAVSQDSGVNIIFWQRLLLAAGPTGVDQAGGPRGACRVDDQGVDRRDRRDGDPDRGHRRDRTARSGPSDELKVLEAAVIAQRATGAPLWVHLMQVPIAEDALRVFDEYEPDFERVVFAHMDFDIRDLTWHERALQRGITVEFDFFGSMWWPIDVFIHCPTDPQRLAVLAQWSERGYADRLLISHDVATAVQFTSYGGFGYTYIPKVVPKLMDQLGIDTRLLDQWMIVNPRRLLAWADA